MLWLLLKQLIGLVLLLTSLKARARSYRKNDNCFAEQKNYSVVRRAFGYSRFLMQSYAKTAGRPKSGKPDVLHACRTAVGAETGTSRLTRKA